MILKITQLNEAHRVSSIAWDKFYRNIKIELAKHPSERIDVKQMIKMSKEEFDRLMETSPNIPEKIVGEFKNNFGRQEIFNKIIKPEICDILIPSSEHRNPWYNEENRAKSITDNIKVELTKQNKIKKINEMNVKIIKDFINIFVNLNNREPTETEIMDNLKDQIDVIIIKKILDDKGFLKIQINVDDNSDMV